MPTIEVREGMFSERLGNIAPGQLFRFIDSTQGIAFLQVMNDAFAPAYMALESGREIVGHPDWLVKRLYPAERSSPTYPRPWYEAEFISPLVFGGPDADS